MKNALLLLVLLSASTGLYAQSKATGKVRNSSSQSLPSPVTQPQIDQSSYYQKSEIPGSGYLDFYSRPIQAQYQEWSETFAVGLYPIPNSTLIRLRVEKKFGETVTVRLLNEEGKVLREEWLDRMTNKIGFNFDFTQSKDSTYTIEVANGQEVLRRTIRLTTVITPGRVIAIR